MRIPKQKHTLGLVALSLGAAILFSPLARAADSAEAKFQADMQRCNTTPGINVEACRREAGAALEAARRNKLISPGAQTEVANRDARCSALPADQRQNCLTLMNEGPGVEVQGSVSSGGIIRTTTVPIPAQ
uniref:hypothetical protein n=1 Tax=Castellaniella defragrans TaxID=75697 RepID=UPI00333F88CA